MHTRTVLGTTLVLILIGWLLFLTFEWAHSLAYLSITDRVANALFLSVTPRTAGFSTVDYASVSNASLFLTMVLMLVGGSPGSTAGGLKTTTLTLLVLLLLARLRGLRDVLVLDRTVPRETIQRATSVAMGGLAVLGSAIFLLLVTEGTGAGVADRNNLAQLIFEAHSAFGTVGLSMGATPELTTVGRLIVSGLMLFGRLGPIVVVAAMGVAQRRGRASFRYGEEDVILG